MPSHQECKYLPYTSQQLFELVADVEKYPEFLPWCLACKIMKKKPEFIEANMIVGFKMVKERFMTRVYLKREEFIIDIEYKLKWMFFEFSLFFWCLCCCSCHLFYFYSLVINFLNGNKYSGYL